MAGDRWLLVGDAGAFLDPIFSTGVLLAMQTGIEGARAVSDGLRRGDLSTSHFAGYERQVLDRYHYFRRFVVGFYDAAFRDLWFSAAAPLGMREAVLSVLAGNWRPSLATRLRLRLFFLFVAAQRRFAFAPRHGMTAPQAVRTSRHVV
jgi:flavin-dependent dehydrogenase